MIYKNISELVGGTPLFEPVNLINKYRLKARILCKLEYKNPAGSAKDRVALSMILDAEEKGYLREGSVIIEPTSGNTGIGLAAIAASRGYTVILTMPESMSKERIKLLQMYGAEVILTPANEGMAGAIKKANELKSSIGNSFIPSQFDNPANPKAHIYGTAEEILTDTNGNIDLFVAGIGTGGTISGTGKRLKGFNSDIKVIGVEPSSSPLITKGTARAHGLQGIGANFVPRNFDPTTVDEIISVSEEEAYTAGRALAKYEGILTGITSGAALHAAIVLAGRKENQGKTIVCLLPDTGERYISTQYFNV